MSTLVDAVKAAVARAVLRVGPGPIGVACSGGADSMALAHATIAAAGVSRVIVYTVDHGLVPGSGEVAGGVADWAHSLGATWSIGKVIVDRGGSLEAAARDARYAALTHDIEHDRLVAMFLGHTARDQAETVLMRILRGTGPAGLAGMPEVRALAWNDPALDRPADQTRTEPVFVRPLLQLPRAATEAYVRELALPVWDDPMNADADITRVRVRDQLLPLLRAENPAVDDALVRLAGATREWLEVIDTAAGPFGQFPIDCPALAGQRTAIRKRALALALDRAGIGYEAAHLDDLDALVTAPARGEVGIDLSGTRAVRSYDRLDLVRVPEPAAGAPRFRAPDGYMLRPWQPGDRMCPLRLKGHSKKLSDLYSDAKVPRDARRIAQVMVRIADDVVVWAEHVGIAFGEALDLAPVPL